MIISKDFGKYQLGGAVLIEEFDLSIALMRTFMRSSFLAFDENYQGHNKHCLD
jgi:hypothetical protein